MTYGKLSDRCLKVFVVLLIAGVLGGFCLPHFVEAVAGGYNTRAVCRLVQKGWRHLFYQLILNRRAASWLWLS